MPELPTHIQRQTHQNMLLGFCRLAFVLVLLGTLLRPLVVTLSPVFTWLGLANLVALATAYVAIRSRLFPNHGIWIMLAVAMFSLLPLLLVSGGVNSQFGCLLPLVPMGAALLGGRIESLAAAAVLVLSIMAMMIAGPRVMDLSGEPWIAAKALPRGFWMILGVIAGSYFGLTFLKRTRNLNQELVDLANSDPLTGLLNRRGFSNAMRRLMNQQRQHDEGLSLLLLDIDHFKTINDRYGHDIGDECLIKVAERLKSSIRGSDLVARFGGEEFIVALANASPTQAIEVAEKLRLVVQAMTVRGVSDPITVTIGVAACHGGVCDQTSMIKAADTALYEGKQSGRNRVVMADCSLVEDVEA
ncbi:GGDEF domain-containing protein [Oceanobacter kriegii]|uniref:GGDEF domain-containing protein n=1 Tax=Oceanobacter kriegii TaxID=64972 RepID=UPI0003FCD4E9|nr:GGDEF domain-containing protein [Oceanobacter kriegii]